MIIFNWQEIEQQLSLFNRIEQKTLNLRNERNNNYNLQKLSNSFGIEQQTEMEQQTVRNKVWNSNSDLNVQQLKLNMQHT